MKKTELLEAWARLKSLAIARQQKLLGAHEIQRFNRYHNFTRRVPDHMFWCALIACFFVFLSRFVCVLTTCFICSNHVLYLF